jgi:copper resistance protein C
VKRFCVFVFFISFLLLSVNVHAHSYIKSSFPESDAVTEDRIDQLVITFDSGIEPSAKIEIFNSNGEDVSISHLDVESPTIKVYLDSALETDDYQVNWHIIGEDGHATNGSYSISVIKPVIEEEIVSEEKKIEEEAPEEESTAEISEGVTEDEVLVEDEAKPKSKFYLIGILAIITIFLIVLQRRKKG